MNYTYRIQRGVTEPEIYRYEVVKRTAKTVTYKKRNGEVAELLECSYHRHYNTFEEAREYCMKSCRIQIKNAKSSIERSEERLKELLVMDDYDKVVPDDISYV